ncbi:MAG: DivIVA domain-containing protein [Clostridiales bacterium]|nr:DivIVA domain-containing protein [Clostridiales bacterium]
MLTPQEITDKKFDKVMVWGYDMNGVDSFLETVEADYTQLYKENITLKSKMKVLIAKIDEYRKVDESMRRALLGAQTMAAEIVERAKKESEEREQQVEQEVSRKLAEMTEHIAAEEQRLEEAKTSAQVFIDRMLGMYEKEREALLALRDREFASAPAPAPATAPAAPAAPTAAPAAVEDDSLPDTVTIPSFDTRSTVYETEPQEDARRRPAPKPRPSSMEDEDGETIVLTPKPRFEFNNLQFGEQYKPGKSGK